MSQRLQVTAQLLNDSQSISLRWVAGSQCYVESIRSQTAVCSIDGKRYLHRDLLVTANVTDGILRLGAKVARVNAPSDNIVLWQSMRYSYTLYEAVRTTTRKNYYGVLFSDASQLVRTHDGQNLYIQDGYRATDGTVHTTDDRRIAHNRRLQIESDRQNGITRYEILGYHGSQQYIAYKFGATGSVPCIGFEVEKTDIPNDCRIVSDIYAGIERDGSCGLEAVTHILPINNNEVRNAIEADPISNCASNGDCGGHISISVPDYSSTDLLQAMIDNGSAGLIYSIWRKRLSNGYVCGRDSSLTEIAVRNDGEKYSPFNIKRNALECRVPSRIRTSGAMLARYNLFSVFAELATVDNIGMAWDNESVKASVLSIYLGDNDKALRALRDAPAYHDYIVTGDADESIEDYIQRCRIYRLNNR